MSSRTYEGDNGGIAFSIDAWSYEICEHGGCETCPSVDFTWLDAAVTFFWNCAMAVALAAAAQQASAR